MILFKSAKRHEIPLVQALPLLSFLSSDDDLTACCADRLQSLNDGWSQLLILIRVSWFFLSSVQLWCLAQITLLTAMVALWQAWEIKIGRFPSLTSAACVRQWSDFPQSCLRHCHTWPKPALVFQIPVNSIQFQTSSPAQHAAKVTLAEGAKTVLVDMSAPPLSQGVDASEKVRIFETDKKGIYFEKVLVKHYCSTTGFLVKNCSTFLPNRSKRSTLCFVITPGISYMFHDWKFCNLCCSWASVRFHVLVTSPSVECNSHGTTGLV